MVRKELTKEQLGESYRIATVRLHELVDRLYEDLFDQEGKPRCDSGNIANMIASQRISINQELELIKDASYEHLESNTNEQSKQEGIFFYDGQGS